MRLENEINDSTSTTNYSYVDIKKACSSATNNEWHIPKVDMKVGQREAEVGEEVSLVHVCKYKYRLCARSVYG